MHGSHMKIACRTHGSLLKLHTNWLHSFFLYRRQHFNVPVGAPCRQGRSYSHFPGSSWKNTCSKRVFLVQELLFGPSRWSMRKPGNWRSAEVAVRPTLAAWCSYWDIEVLSTVKKKWVQSVGVQLQRTTMSSACVFHVTPMRCAALCSVEQTAFRFKIFPLLHWPLFDCRGGSRKL
jgi:hypothetical protein